MALQDKEFQKKLLDTFRIEAREHLDGLSSDLIELEKAPAERHGELVETVFRRAHSLKGAARAVNLRDVESVCQALESVFAALKARKKTPSPRLFDLLQDAVNGLEALLSQTDAGPSSAGGAAVESLIQRLQRSLPGSAKPHKRDRARHRDGAAMDPKADPLLPAAEGRAPTLETVRVPVSRLDALFLQTEELLAMKLAATQRSGELAGLFQRLTLWSREWAKVRPFVRSWRFQAAANGHDGPISAPGTQEKRVMEFLEWNREFMESLSIDVTSHTANARQNERSLGGMVDQLIEEMKKVLMLSFSSLLDIFPRLVREISREQGKEVELLAEGGEIEIDRRILEEMKDPLIHIVRNCLDHGIEKPEVRENQGKPRRGTIAIRVSPRENQKVEIAVSDDGAGIEAEAVKATAGRMGILKKEDAEGISDENALALVFQSGLSTTPIITDISGRGLGLAIVREKVDSLGGTIAIDSRRGEGTTFRILLPLTLATFRGIIFELGDRLFVLPTSSVERVLHVAASEVKTVENRESIQFNGRAVSLVAARDLLEIARARSQGDAPDRLQVIVLCDGSNRVAFQVDRILDEQEVLVKSLGKQLSRLRFIAGATILGNGKVVPILHVRDLMHAAESGAFAPAATSGSAEDSATTRRRLLVVEDSITSRSLLKSILESAGYAVDTAVDGIDGFTKLRGSRFDLVVSDVDMPRMNGFGLTAKIRADKSLAELPVVLVTALESREDKERGIDAGANAYIVKSSFDQSNLLEVIQRLI